MMYLSYGKPELFRKLLGFCAFLPQVICVVGFTFKYSRDLPFCWLITTIAFVAFNKVCTSQYFIWYLSFIPVVLPSLHLTFLDCVRMASFWGVSQGLWLAAAYSLEFRGYNAFMYIWTVSLLLLGANVYIINQLRAAHSFKHANMRHAKE
ncbi:hypothetical protein L596_002120 [Steinernema carpocapsae]|uniref:GPI alpha-1,4-mannosyltransferase I, catalytic subunit n=1 Tax=Steinernema carpocapsae TaxID=34508 RepID=A0A4U8UNA0_STECR|nr:hypothetical protein L596_002120 [Steinernema carpocapsae]